MHRIINLAIVISLTFATLICLSEKDFCAIAYETPSDIHLLIETKEIDINDIPENRMISLDIYTENCPPCLMLSFLLEKDENLEYLPYEYLTDAEQVSNMSGMSFELGTSETSDVVLCNIPALANEKINYNGLLVRANVILPEDVKAGDFYSLNFRRTFFDTYNMETSIILENDFDAVFGSESFSQLKGGGVLITQGEKASQEMIYNETLSESVQEENQFSESEITDTEIFKSTEISENVSAETSIQTTSSEITSDVDLSFSDDVSYTKTTVTVINYGNKTEDNKKGINKIFMICLTAGIVIFIKKRK